MGHKVLAGAPCAKMPVYDHFYDCLGALELPGNSLRMRAQGGSVPRNLNTLVETALEHDCTHLFIVEDDSEFATDTVTRLLAHKVPVVAGLCRARNAPFRSYIYKGRNDDGLGWYALKPEDTGLIGGVGWFAGMGGILIETEVLTQMTFPYFECYFDDEGREWGQDNVFGNKLMDLGVPCYCDTDVIIGHATGSVIGSRRDADGWKITVQVGAASVALPQVDQ